METENIKYISTTEIAKLDPCAVGIYARVVTDLVMAHQEHMLPTTPEEVTSFMEKGHSVIALNEAGNVIGYCRIMPWGNYEGTQIFELGSLISIFERHGIGTQLIHMTAQALQGLSNVQLIAVIDKTNEPSLKLFGNKLDLPLLFLTGKAKEVILSEGWDQRAEVFDLNPLINSSIK